MIEEIKQLLDEYARWLRDQSVLREVGDWVEITTPYMDRHNDHLQIYARRANGRGNVAAYRCAHPLQVGHGHNGPFGQAALSS